MDIFDIIVEIKEIENKHTTKIINKAKSCSLKRQIKYDNISGKIPIGIKRHHT